MAATASKAPANFANVAGASASATAADEPSAQRSKSSHQGSMLPSQRSGIMRESVSHEKHAHDRLLFLAANFIGLQATVTVGSGEEFTGIFAGATFDVSDPHFLLKMTRKVSSPSQPQANGAPGNEHGYVGHGDDHAMSFETKDLVRLAVDAVPIDKVQLKQSNGATSSFRTDADISGNLLAKSRELQRWEPEAGSTVGPLLNGTGGSAWDQFETNERLYGVRTDYDESFYTTAIDRSNPSYRERAAAADRIAREIESSAPTSAHVAEERGIDNADGDGLDEEDKYSGVRRDPIASLAAASSNRYTPPARRAPTAQTTVRGAPVDPAIISSQLMQSEPSYEKQERTENIPPTTSVPSASQKADVAAAQRQNAAAKSMSKVTPVATPAATPKPTAALRPPEKAPQTQLPATPTSTLTNTSNTSGAASVTQGVEAEVLKHFKDFSAQERSRVLEREKQRRQREKEVKLNDLKKFALNFKLKTEVPQDMLGILAKDATKQAEIVEKAKRELEDVNSSKRASTSTSAASSQQSPDKSVGTAAGFPASGAPTTPQSKSVRNAQAPHGARPSASQSQRPGPGHLGERLLANQQRIRAFQNAQQPFVAHDHRQQNTPIPAAVNTDLASSKPASAGFATPTSAGPRFNAHALEFRPNPTAVSFSPGKAQARPFLSPSASRNGSSMPNGHPKRGNFFGDRRPSGQKKLISDAFNPVLRMKREVEADGKSKEFASNGGIPPAFRTDPQWATSDKNKDVSYRDVLEKTNPHFNVTHGSGPIPHQHQLPPHLQTPAPLAMHNPTLQPIQSQQYPHFSQSNAGQPFMDDQRMQMSMSNSSMFPSPRFQQGMVMPAHMVNPTQSPYSTPGQPIMPSHPQSIPFVRQLSNNSMMRSPAQMVPMMVNQGGGSPYMGGPVQGQMHMYSPGQQPMMPQGIGPQTPGAANGFPSPRPGAPLMMASSSQQGQFFYPGQPGQPVFTQHAQQVPMRPGMPMSQGSFSASPHMGHHFPNQHRQPSFGAQGYTQQIAPSHMMQQHVRPSSGPHDEVK